MPRQITKHELRVYRYVKANRRRWATADEIAEGADVAPRTARHHALGLTQRGVLERAEVFGGYRYRLASPVSDYAAELDAAGVVLGV